MTAKPKTTELIRYPFPDMRLSPNSRKDHRRLTNERQYARQVGYYITLDSKLGFSGEKPLELYMLICPPDRRRRDDDNIEAAFKSTRDGIFKALGLDDNLIRRTVREVGDVEEGGAVYISLKELDTAGWYLEVL